MLGVPVVQILAGVSLVATVVGLIVLRPGRPLPRGAVRVVATREPARWTHGTWIAAAFISILWPVGILLAPKYAYHAPALPDFPYSWAVQILGFFATGIGGLLLFGGARSLGKHMTPVIRVQEGHELVREGPYRYIRHPVYSAIVTVAGGQTLLYLSLPLVLLTVLLATLANYRARIEEDLLRSPEAFGEEYDAYVATTGRFVPRLLRRSKAVVPRR